MDADIERIIQHYYPARGLVSPLENKQISWDYDPQNTTIKAIHADLEKLGAKVQLGTRGTYDVSEEILVDEVVRLQICYLGPYAAVNFGNLDALDASHDPLLKQVEAVLAKHRTKLLSHDDLREHVDWIESAPSSGPITVWNCLFVPEEQIQ